MNTKLNAKFLIVYTIKIYAILSLVFVLLFSGYMILKTYKFKNYAKSYVEYINNFNTTNLNNYVFSIFDEQKLQIDFINKKVVTPNNSINITDVDDEFIYLEDNKKISIIILPEYFLKNKLKIVGMYYCSNDTSTTTELKIKKDVLNVYQQELRNVYTNFTNKELKLNINNDLYLDVARFLAPVNEAELINFGWNNCYSQVNNLSTDVSNINSIQSNCFSCSIYKYGDLSKYLNLQPTEDEKKEKRYSKIRIF